MHTQRNTLLCLHIYIYIIYSLFSVASDINCLRNGKVHLVSPFTGLARYALCFEHMMCHNDEECHHRSSVPSHKSKVQRRAYLLCHHAHKCQKWKILESSSLEVLIDSKRERERAIEVGLKSANTYEEQ